MQPYPPEAGGCGEQVELAQHPMEFSTQSPALSTHPPYWGPSIASIYLLHCPLRAFLAIPFTSLLCVHCLLFLCQGLEEKLAVTKRFLHFSLLSSSSPANQPTPCVRNHSCTSKGSSSPTNQQTPCVRNHSRPSQGHYWWPPRLTQNTPRRFFPKNAISLD